MSTFVPDLWLMYVTNEEVRLFCSWNGSYDKPGSWRKSSKISLVEPLVNGFLSVRTVSGNVYLIDETNYGCTGWANGVLSHTIRPDRILPCEYAMQLLNAWPQPPELTDEIK